MTVSRALAVVGPILEAKPVRYALEAYLGRGEIPKPDTFGTDDLGTVPRWDRVLMLIDQAVGVLLSDAEERPVQRELGE